MKDELSDKEVLRAWHINAGPWIRAIENSEIKSRKLVTDRAILETIEELAPENILDIGCGEGWLANKLAVRGIKVTGIDAVPELIAKAESGGNAVFEICAYEELAGHLFAQKFDCLICNFSLIGKDATDDVVKTAKSLLCEGGWLVIQTLHPLTALPAEEYRDGWRKGSWAGFSKDFTIPPPWYFRTMGTWEELFKSNGFQTIRKIEPIHPETGGPASIIFICA